MTQIENFPILGDDRSLQEHQLEGEAQACSAENLMLGVSGGQGLARKIVEIIGKLS